MGKKRNLKILTYRDKAGIRAWLKCTPWEQEGFCPIRGGCSTCKALFPNIPMVADSYSYGGFRPRCPCKSFPLPYVRKVARLAVGGG